MKTEEKRDGSDSLDELVGCEIIPDQESCQPTPTIYVLYCDNFGCAANEEARCMSTLGECYGYIKPNNRIGRACKVCNVQEKK